MTRPPLRRPGRALVGRKPANYFMVYTDSESGPNRRGIWHNDPLKAIK